MDDDVVEAVIAHEVGHIVCHHVLYHTIGAMIMNGVIGLLGLGELMTEALNIAFQYWNRCSEYSADRAAAIYCGKAEPVVDVMMHLAAGTRELYQAIDRDLFISQADEYAKYVGDSKWNKFLEFMEMKDMEHPFLALRAKAILEFEKTKNFQNLVNKLNDVPQVTDKSHCPHCGAAIQPGYTFCKKCGKKIDI